MANVVKKHTISSELAQKMVDEAVDKAKEPGITENVAILDDGGNLKAFSRMDGAPILCIEMAQNKAYTALFGVSTQDFFNFIQGDPSLLAGIPTLARVAAWGGGFPIKVNGEVVGAIGLSGAPTVQNDVDCARAALALVPRSEEHTSELQSRFDLVCRLLLEKKKTLTVTEDAITNEQVAQQRDTDFSGERSIRLPMHVLRADFDALRIA